jgi:alkyl sulfatase BDS1-like metallo-beta-lactamase superfamily hydrolase
MDLLGALTVDQVLASIGIRVDGPKAWDEHLVMCWNVTDLDLIYESELRNGVLIHHVVESPPEEATTFTLTRLTLIGLLTRRIDFMEALADGTVTVEGDAGVLVSLVGLLAKVDPSFPIVTP